MAYIDPDGMFGGDRMAMLSDSAKMAWPWFWCAGNTVGRIELNYREFVKGAFRQFKTPPTEEQFWEWVAEFHESYLMFVYEINGQAWGQWWVSEKYLPTYKAVSDKRTPAPMVREMMVWQDKYAELKVSLISGKCRVLTISKTFTNISPTTEEAKEFPLGEERRGEIEERENQNQRAPEDALVLTPPVDRSVVRPPAPARSRGGKRTTEDITKALGPRLPWWEAFWSVFPGRDGEKEGMDAFERTVTTRELATLVYRGAQRYAALFAAQPDMKLKYPQGWINGERWKDACELPRPPSNGAPSTETLAQAIEAFGRTR